MLHILLISLPKEQRMEPAGDTFESHFGIEHDDENKRRN
jgi:hypothetical protein